MRDTLTSTVDLRADGDGSGTVDEADYDVWVAHYGAECPAFPGEFTITGPVGVQTQKDNTISWTPSEGATSYRFVLSQQPDASFPLIDEAMTETSRSLRLNDGTYYVAIYAQNPSGETLASNAVFAITVELPPSEQLIFVSASRYFISTASIFPPPNSSSFGNVLAADWHCTNIANNVGLLSEPWDGVTRHFRALLTEGGANVRVRASMRQGVYYNTAGNVIAEDLSDLLAGVRLAPVLTQSGVQLTGTQVVWTGANTDGSSANNCVNWSETIGAAQAGNLNGAGTNWLFQGNVNCNSLQRLYCFGDRGTFTATAQVAAIESALISQPTSLTPPWSRETSVPGAKRRAGCYSIAPRSGCLRPPLRSIAKGNRAARSMWRPCDVTTCCSWRRRTSC